MSPEIKIDTTFRSGEHCSIEEKTKHQREAVAKLEMETDF
jgi:hypothetical protein